MVMAEHRRKDENDDGSTHDQECQSCLPFAVRHRSPPGSFAGFLRTVYSS
jgi:hypothetical protein